MFSLVLCTNATVDPFGEALLVCTAKGIPGDESITMSWKYDGKTSAGQPEVDYLGNDTNHVVRKAGHQTTLVIREVGRKNRLTEFTLIYALKFKNKYYIKYWLVHG